MSNNSEGWLSEVFFFNTYGSYGSHLHFFNTYIKIIYSFKNTHGSYKF